MNRHILLVLTELSNTQTNDACMRDTQPELYGGSKEGQMIVRREER